MLQCFPTFASLLICLVWPPPLLLPVPRISTRYSTHTRVLFHVLARIWLNIAISLTRDYCCLIFFVPALHRGVTEFFALPYRPSKRAFWLNARHRYTLTHKQINHSSHVFGLLEELAFLCTATWYTWIHTVNYNYLQLAVSWGLTRQNGEGPIKRTLRSFCPSALKGH